MAVALVVYNTLSDKRYYDGNLYFTEKKAWSPAMKALVLNAGKLDEVSWDPRKTTPRGRELSTPCPHWELPVGSVEGVQLDPIKGDE